MLENFQFGKTFHTELTTNLCSLDDVVIGLAGVVWGATACVCVQTTFERADIISKQTLVTEFVRKIAETAVMWLFQVSVALCCASCGFTMHAIEFHLLIDKEA